VVKGEGIMAASKDLDQHTANPHSTSGSGELSLRSASLGSPMFEESWDAGSPLNWVEFVTRWEDRRRPARPNERQVDR
jgi:hypothetical protein